MFIEKAPEKAAKNKEAQKALEKEPVAQPATKKDELKGLPYQDQVKATSPRKDEPKRAVDAVQAKDPVGDLKKLFNEMGLTDKLVPANVESFTFDPKSGALSISLKAGFSRQFDKDNTVTFERSITGTLTKGALTGISGIKRGSAAITDISRPRSGIVAIRGHVGPFSKTLEFKDEQIPSL